MARQIFLNLPVRDLERSKAFFTKLGFEFNPQFTDNDCACMVINEEAFVMLLTEKRFRDFTTKELVDTSRNIEGLFAFSAESRKEVDEIAEKALASGGSFATDPVDMKFMYYRTFLDPDGHHWEVMWMDPAMVQAQ